MPFPGPGRKWQISTAGGRVIAWKDDGTEIYYQDPGGQILAAEVGVRGETFLVGQVETLFAGPPMAVDPNVDVSGDGQRFLALVPEQRMGTRPLNLVFGWPQLLTQR